MVHRLGRRDDDRAGRAGDGIWRDVRRHRLYLPCASDPFGSAEGSGDGGHREADSHLRRCFGAMPKLHDRWTVLPHGPLREIDDGLLTVVGQIPMPLGNFPRRMTVVALAGRRTLLFSPISLEEAEM